MGRPSFFYVPGTLQFFLIAPVGFLVLSFPSKPEASPLPLLSRDRSLPFCAIVEDLPFSKRGPDAAPPRRNGSSFCVDALSGCIFSLYPRYPSASFVLPTVYRTPTSGRLFRVRPLVQAFLRCHQVSVLRQSHLFFFDANRKSRDFTESRSIALTLLYWTGFFPPDLEIPGNQQGFAKFFPSSSLSLKE